MVTKASKFDIGFSLLIRECWWLLWIPINASLPAGSVYGVGVMCCHWYLHLPLSMEYWGGGVFAVGTYNCYPGDGVGGCFGYFTVHRIATLHKSVEGRYAMCLPWCGVIAMGTYNCHSPRGWCGGHGQPVGKQFDVCVHVLRLCLY